MDSGTTFHDHDSALCARMEEASRRVRCQVVRMLDASREGHLGGALSLVEMLCALYMHHMKIDPSNPRWKERDRFVLSKGHASAALYAVLAEVDYFSKKELLSLRQVGSRMLGHPDMRKTPGVDMSTGSLGIGISAAVGMAIGGRLQNASWRVYAIIGDGESQSGAVWEAAMAATHFELDNLTVMLDYNKLQIDGRVSKVMGIEPVRAKWEAFGWHVQEIDGHCMPDILDALDGAMLVEDKPQFVIAHTIKGKGYSRIENVAAHHGMRLTHEQCMEALEELQREER